MGSAMFEIGQVLGSRGNTKAKRLRNGGTLYARVTAAPSSAGRKLHVSLRGVQLKNLERFGKSDPFLEMSAKVPAADSRLAWLPVYRSKHIMSQLNPKWEPFSVDLDRVCGEHGNDFCRPIRISVWDWKKNGKHQPMGSFETTVDGLIARQASGGSGDVASVDTSRAFALRQNGKECGRIVVTTAKVGDGTAPSLAPIAASPAAPSASLPTSMPIQQQTVPPFSQALQNPPPSFAASAVAVSAATSMYPSAPSAATSMYPRAPSAPIHALEPLPPPMAPPAARPSFVDYISGGCELELAIAIDFTGSNGDPRQHGTLHYIHRDGQLNDYEKALTAVGSVVARYDSDQRFPVYGFGAKFNGVIQHCFQVGNAPLLYRLSGVLEGYRSVFRSGLTMSGPTVFAEVIDLVAATARSNQESAQKIGKQAYKILLILTDGAVSDIEQTKRALHNASDAPLSIVIVGIGSADFSAMQFLDDFQRHNGGEGRDICQFVEFSRFSHDKAALTRETLEEIPDQLVDYFHGRGIKPLPPVSGSQLTLVASEPDEEDIDLSIQVDAEGEISLANYNGAVYDDTKYDTFANYGAPSPLSPSAPSAPYQSNYTPHGAASPYQPQAYQASAPHYQRQPYSAPHTNPPVPSYPAHTPSRPPDPPVAVAATAPPPVFHVQVPPSVTPGMQLQVQNPVTGQQMIVTVPQGVSPGGKFAVRY